MATATEIQVGRIVGAPVARKEDRKLLTGQAQFVDDISLPGMVWLAGVRSPYAHPRLEKLQISDAPAARDGQGALRRRRGRGGRGGKPRGSARRRRARARRLRPAAGRDRSR